MPKTLYSLLNPKTLRIADLMLDDGEGGMDARVNAANRQVVVTSWSLGPEEASVDPDANPDYWRKMADLWMIEEPEARRRFCANCEYFDNSVKRMEEMEAVPLDKFDMDGGGRGYCTKFDFICHNLRVCQAWEPCESKEED
jgi:hypothetical protein